jgi:hypothetical protein
MTPTPSPPGQQTLTDLTAPTVPGQEVINVMAGQGPERRGPGPGGMGEGLLDRSFGGYDLGGVGDRIHGGCSGC